MEDRDQYNIAWLNAMPVNEKAKRMLVEAEQTPDTTVMYWVQMAGWGVEKGLICVDTQNSLVETIKAMATWSTARLMNFFIISDEKDYDPPGWRNTDSPVDLARAALDDIENKMFLHFPWYGSLEI
jgi:hypothetical protein